MKNGVNMLRKILNFKKNVSVSFQGFAKFSEFHKKMMIQSLQESKRYDNPLCLTRYGYKVYSKNEEDGIIQEIFNRIGTTNKTFVELILRRLLKAIPSSSTSCNPVQS